MRRFWIVAALFVGLACACPNIGGLQETLSAVQGTVGSVLTEMPEMMTEFPGMLTDLPGTIEAGMETPDFDVPGVILGNLSYPSEYIPAQKIVAFDVGSMIAIADVVTTEGDSEYELTVPAGDYYVVAYTLDGSLAAGYSQAVPCGLLATCTDHSLIAVHVGPGDVLTGIDPQDWYAPPGTFPAMP
jgi:hypothetical protein